MCFAVERFQSQIMSLFAAVDAQGNTRYIGEVARGAACGCFCSECKSPVVAKHGTDHAWHFAHEASQERPQCLPGSVNLLRRLAVETLLESDTLVMPECRQVFTATVHFSSVEEVACWTLPVGRIAQRDIQAAVTKPVARYSLEGRPDCTIGLWVQIGDLNLEIGGDYDGELVYHCPAPSKGEITTQDSAVAFLQKHSRWRWQKLPDISGARRQAQERLQGRVESLQAEPAERLRRLRELHRLRNGLEPVQQRSSSTNSPEYGEESHASLLEQAPAPRPEWADFRKKNSSFFAFQLHTSREFWIVMQAADHPGYYVVPGAGLWDGWDEALPRSFGQADLLKGAYSGDGSINDGIQMMRNLGVAASRTDSDVGLICAFTGWKACT